MVLRLTIFAGTSVPIVVHAACLTLGSYPNVTPLAEMELPVGSSDFSLVYVHSVTHTPVAERYHIDGGQIVETRLEFEQHGPGLPTEADSGGTFSVRDGHFFVTMNRQFPAIVMQVHADQAPRLVIGTHSRDLAQWGNRALVLGVATRPCNAM